MGPQDDDLVMESTTDSPDQIAEGLGLEVSAEPADTEDVEVEAAAAGEDDAAIADTPLEGADEAPVGEVTTEPARVAAAKPRTARPQRKTVDSAAAAARRKAEGDRKALEAENQALRDRLALAVTGQLPPAPAARTEVQGLQPAVIQAEQIPDTHPRVAAELAKLTALGAKPKQDAFEDYTAFEDARDEWIENRARIRARTDTVREDVARQASISQTEANRAAQAQHAAFAQTVETTRERHADYDDVMDNARTTGLAMNSVYGPAIAESPIGGEVVYFLATHPEEMQRINGLSPTRGIAELGILEARLSASIRPGQKATPAARPVARHTRAPEPQEVLLGDMSAPRRARDLNDPKLSFAEYKQQRDEMDRESGRRTH